jgi:hypothetical protein
VTRDLDTRDLEGAAHEAREAEPPDIDPPTLDEVAHDDGRSYSARIRAGAVDPWIGTGADGARRSAQIARDEIGSLVTCDPRRAELEAQAAAWDARARTLDTADALARQTFPGGPS